ncbi:hypothetical protein CCHR01_17469 [Colletotrichum chrysophilum]|uniref:Uncharacterized protein n=1 Tax=Colletotrichum chrysophilum TaxID=1836956 RepID=A0AAD9E9U8_9PEZI|nr:hypothetical protein CCHR01_17469 [Colletotrichum chrysophilum]
MFPSSQETWKRGDLSQPGPDPANCPFPLMRCTPTPGSCWRPAGVAIAGAAASSLPPLSTAVGQGSSPMEGNYCQHHLAPQQHLFPSSGHHARTPKRYLPALPILHPLIRTSSAAAAATAAATDSNSAIAGPPVPQLVLVIS